MVNQRFITAFSRIAPDPAADRRVLNAMCAASRSPRVSRPSRRAAVPALCVLLIAGVAVSAALGHAYLKYEYPGGQLRFLRGAPGAAQSDALVGDLRDLTEAECTACFPTLSFTSAFGFFMNGEVAAFNPDSLPEGALYGAEASLSDARIFLSRIGYGIRDAIAYDPDALGEPEDLDGTPVYTACFVTDPNSRGERTVIYTTVFEKDGWRVEAELASPAAQYKEAADRITALTKTLIASDICRLDDVRLDAAP